MIQNELVSIILPTYNGQQYLPPLLESLLNQTFSNLEIITIDDCSIDDTVKIVKQYSAIDNRITLIVNEKNIGINCNFEKGINQAAGKYIFLCDQDDIWDKNKVEKMIHKLNEGFDLVYCDLRTINSEDVVTAPSFHRLIGTNHLYSKSLTKYLLFRNITNGCSISFKREIIDKICPFPEQMIYDWWIMINASLNYKIGYIKTPLMSYRIHDHNAVGLVITDKTSKDKIEGIRQAIERTNCLLLQINDDYLVKKLNTIKYYHENRCKIYSQQSNHINYLLACIKTLFSFPRLYKNLLKNLLQDTMPRLHNAVLNIWLRSKMNSNEK